MDYQPPPFFKRGPAPFALLSFYALLSLSLLVLDARFHALELLRQACSIVTYPLQKAAQTPVQVLRQAAQYFADIASLQAENAALHSAHLNGAEALLRTRHLEAENQRLRRLLNIKERDAAHGQVVQILYAARDPFTRRIVLDQGQQGGMLAGQPVIDDFGIIGQVTRVFPFVSEVTLITDKDQAIPVQVVRNGLRSVVFGLGNGQLELRFIPANADVQNGDLLVTSGLDGLFLPGFPVAKVVHIERDTAYAFARIYCVPVAAVENFGEVMVLSPRPALALPKEIHTTPAPVVEAPSKHLAEHMLRNKKKAAKKE